MMSLDEFVRTLDDLVQSMPAELFRYLNGGVNVSEKAPLSDISREDQPQYVLGHYHHQRVMGRWITLYYGSFEKVYGGATESFVIAEMERVLRHEIRHHLENLAGERDLEEEDIKQARAYLGQL